jgi:WD40 repeat protein
MSDSHRLEGFAVDNKRSLKKLAWAIEASMGQFKLFLARCNYASLRSQLVEQLQEQTSVNIRILELKEQERTLFARMQMELGEDKPDALMIFNLESVDDLDELLTATNQVREEFRKHFHFPLVLWVNDEVLEKLLRLAPDFESWATTTEFAMATHELIESLQQSTDLVFDSTLSSDVERVWDRMSVVTCVPTEMGFLSCREEIEAALKDLQSRGNELEPALKASLEFVRGQDAFVKNEIETALDYFQNSLAFWQQMQPASSLSAGEQEGNQNLKLRAGILLFYIGLCYFHQAERYSSKSVRYWEEAKRYFQQCESTFEQINRLDLVLKFINLRGEVLQSLEAWDELQNFANNALTLQQSAHDLGIIPDDNASDVHELSVPYGFLAEAALKQSRWEDAKQAAQTALDIIAKTTGEQRHQQGRYLLLLAEAKRYLGQPKIAINHLEAAKKVASQDEPKLYIRILETLRSLYFEQKQYLEAFRVKKERQSIEQQYGFRAFSGAGYLQSKQQLQSIETQSIVPLQGRTQELVAPEIIASGRQQDVECLIERIGRTDYKLIVIHGYSGVGKSSLVNAGLVPALRHKTIGTQTVLPVAMRVYTDWVRELGRLLAEALVQKGISLPTSLDSVSIILEQLRLSQAHNLRIVLIFDQFEEFFFVHHNPVSRLNLLNFLGECLNILPVKVILSLREDYLHYLLECNRMSSMAIIGNDILSSKILYRIGNFSPSETQSIIQELTERSNFSLEPDLIKELVQDLTDDFDEVRPIELQVVGTQLQTENITTLFQYLERGPKEELIKRYLAEVVENCGNENRQTAELMLYLLTDEKGTRPLKTRTELEVDFKELSTEFAEKSNKFDLILNIFVESGLVFMLPEYPCERYQLIHDYLAYFIRQEQESKLEFELKLTKKQLKHLLHQEQQARRQEQQARRQVEIAGIELLNLLSEARLLANDQLGALIASLKAGRKIQETDGVSDKVKSRTVVTLQQACYFLQERNRFQGHHAAVLDVKFSLNGDMILSASADNAVKLWNVDGTLLQIFQGHTSWVWGVSFSPDSQIIASASADKTVKLWKIDGTLLQTCQGHSDRVRSVDFSPDGQSIVSASDDTSIKLWNLDGTLEKTFQGHSNWVIAVSFSPDGQLIASASFDNTIKLWHINGSFVKGFPVGNCRVLDVCFSPDSKLIVSANDDKTVKLWKLDGTLLQTFEGHTESVLGVSFSSDGQRIASSGEDNTVKVWHIDGTSLQTFQGHSGKVWSVSFSPDGKQIASASNDETVRLWSFINTLGKSFQGHSKTVNKVSFSPNGKTIASASDDDTVRLWSIDGMPLQTFRGHSSRVNSVSFSPDGQKIASASSDTTVKIWDIDGELVRAFNECGGKVLDVSFSPDGQRVAAAIDNNTVQLWNIDGTLLQTFQGHSGKVWSVSFSPDSQIIASGSDDKTVRLWHLDGTLLQTFEGHTNRVWCVNFSPDGQKVASASFDKTIRIWHVNGTLIQICQGHEDRVYSVSFSPDGKRITSASSDMTIKLWHIDGTLLKTFKGHTARVLCAMFSQDGRMIVSSSADKTVKTWQLDGTEGILLDNLLLAGCSLICDYLRSNPTVSDEEHQLLNIINDSLEKIES